MAAPITIKMHGLPNLKKALKGASADILGAVHQANVNTALDIETEAKQFLQAANRGGNNTGVDTGRLQSSIHVETGENRAHGVRWEKPYFNAPGNVPSADTGQSYDGSLNVPIAPGGAVVGTNVEYAAFVHFGRRAGAKPPPSDKLKPWLRRHGLPESLAFVVARAISRRGIPAIPFLLSAARIVEPKHVARLGKIVKARLT